ncbi:hypothetical protein KIH45_18225 [Croceicoccus sp. 1NDH52]|nr:hypothetical protein [Croceicoccus gelatinilyticus]
MNIAVTLSEPAIELLRRCVSFDIEVNPKTAEIFAFAAVRYGNGAAIRAGKGGLARALDEMDAGLSQSDHCIGHNIVRHDLPHLATVRPNLGRIVHAPIDTLWLNSLAFPRDRSCTFDPN